MFVDAARPRRARDRRAPFRRADDGPRHWCNRADRAGALLACWRSDDEVCALHRPGTQVRHGQRGALDRTGSSRAAQRRPARPRSTRCSTWRSRGATVSFPTARSTCSRSTRGDDGDCSTTAERPAATRSSTPPRARSTAPAQGRSRKPTHPRRRTSMRSPSAPASASSSSSGRSCARTRCGTSSSTGRASRA